MGETCPKAKRTQMRMNPRGSIWRKWDVQVHTPYSELNHSFGEDFSDFFGRLLDKADTHRIAAVGLTDYFSIEGYKRAHELMKDASFLESLDPEVRNFPEESFPLRFLHAIFF